MTAAAGKGKRQRVFEEIKVAFGNSGRAAFARSLKSRCANLRELPDMMSASKGVGGHGKVDVVKEIE